MAGVTLLHYSPSTSGFTNESKGRFLSPTQYCPGEPESASTAISGYSKPHPGKSSRHGVQRKQDQLPGQIDSVLDNTTPRGPSKIGEMKKSATTILIRIALFVGLALSYAGLV